MEENKRRHGFAENMSAAQKRRNRIIKAKEEQAALPETLADQAPRGPLQVKNQVIGILRQSPTGGVVIRRSGALITARSRSIRIT